MSTTYLTESEIKFVSQNYNRVVEFDRMTVRQDFPYIFDMTLLPDDFEEQYSKFVSANAKMLRNLRNKYGYDPDQAFSKRAFMYTDGSKNFYQWAISNHFQNGTSMTSIRRIMSWNEVYGQMAKNLRKNTITAYTSGEDIMHLSEELRLLRRDKRINDTINMFNTAQKRILRAKSESFTDKDKETLSKFYRLSETKKVNFVRKMSTIEDYDEIMRQMRHITSTHFDWNKDSFMDFIKNVEGMKYETIYDNGDVVLVKVEDYETVKNLAKTTNWCISKNKTYWNQYVEQRCDSVQYMVFDFSKKEDDLLSIIGFTTEYNKGITHAHDFTNNDMMKVSDSSESMFLKSFISKFSNDTGIYNVLKNCGIDITLVAQYDKPLYEWNKETMYKYLYECVKKGNVDILRDKGNQVVISVKDQNVRYFLGDTYIDNIGSDNYSCQHIIFMDFGMSEYDPNRIIFAIIRNQEGEQEDYCVGMFNEHAEGINVSFDTKLSQFDLPYDIIRRSDNEYVKINSAYRSCNVPMLKKLLNGVHRDVLEEVIYDYIGGETAVNIISSSITSSMSFDFLDAFYDNGIKLSDVFEPPSVGLVLKNTMVNLINHGRNGNMNGDYKIPTQEDIDRFFSNECTSIDEAYYIGSYLAIKKIIAKENGCRKPNNMYRRLMNCILMVRNGGEVFEDIAMTIANQLNFSEPHDTVDAWVKFAYAHGSEKMKEYTIKNILQYSFAKKSWDNIESFIKSRENNQYTSHIANIRPEGDIADAGEGGEDGDAWEFIDDDDEEFFDEGHEEQLEGDGIFEEAMDEEPAQAF
jgi:hypothetical protein